MMNKTAIKNYAVLAREQLIESCKQRAYEYDVTEDGNYVPNLKTVRNRILTDQESEQRNQLIDQIRQKGYAQVMEEAAYTWFNRFIALRFMEVNGYLPSKVRVFTDDTGAFKPELLKEAMTIELEGIDRSRVLELLDKQDNEELYKYLLITQCNALSEGLPYMFEKISNWTELLFPANLLRNDSVVGRMISDIPEEDWDNEVEIIGWFYQYYISEKHEEVVDPLHGKVINKEDIPAATQLFTTDWVVRYILDNSLGRYWIERHPESNLAKKLTYFVSPRDSIIPTINENILPEELKVLDPCVGSGHFLSYAFDILLEIYRECGWSDRDAAKSIIENNMYGLDIDDRAAQLACFAVMMKARRYNRRIISADTKLNILAMQDSTSISDDLINYISKRNSSVRNDLNEIRLIFNNAKEYGSIIAVPHIDFSTLYAQIDLVNKAPADSLLEMTLQRETIELLIPLIHQAEILGGKYDVVATNPPYMNKYSALLKAYIGEHYEAYKGDLFSVFLYRNFGFCKPNGYSGFMTPMVWMFIKTYEPIRRFIIEQKSITTLIQFEYSAFEEATVPICSFVLKNGPSTVRGQYIKLSNFRGGMEVQRIKTEEAIHNRSCGFYFEADDNNFSKILGCPIAYWAAPSIYDAFLNRIISTYGWASKGIITGDNERFLRLWYEVSSDRVCYNAENYLQAIDSKKKWFPANKGGAYRKWYGNNDYVMNWFDNGKEIMQRGQKKTRNCQDYKDEYKFIPSITWTSISSAKSSFRYSNHSLSESAGMTLFIDAKYTMYAIALLNSKVAEYMLSILNPTLNYTAGTISSLPLILIEGNQIIVESIAEECVEIEKTDWDSFETSWDFKKHPLI